MPKEKQTVYLYRWSRMGRKGQRCIVICRGALNSCWVRFEDGHDAVTSRNALRKDNENRRDQGQKRTGKLGD